MNTETLLGLGSALFGGSAVAFVNHLGTREKGKAEADKLRAEAEQIRFQTSTHMSTGLSIDPKTEIPGWQLTGDRAFEDYEALLDSEVTRHAGCSARIDATPRARGFATLMQSVDATPFRGQRLRMTAWVRTESVRKAAIWMRVDGPDGNMLAFDNMFNRPIKGTTGWCQYSIVLNVTPESLMLAFGFMLSGRGRVWADDFSFEEVGLDVPTTQTTPAGYEFLTTPQNLGFDDPVGLLS
ncbi:hypothetical protein J7E99_38410 [Streptomyces sp. ISL-44]|uniref:hypothetical protein n=1 Tax=Streptomyces sp. ISL-44 TaxID=2819184 RepID=UPI001BEB6E36|nr:hypothetical protein [Streptomyces sp. ISL-44]MBT2546383.1 hypothetical protein [Streptomyces sp. ISL-44]